MFSISNTIFLRDRQEAEKVTLLGLQKSSLEAPPPSQIRSELQGFIKEKIHAEYEIHGREAQILPALLKKGDIYKNPGDPLRVSNFLFSCFLFLF